MTQLKRLLDEPGSDLDRVLLEAGMDEVPPARSLDRTLAAIGIGGALTVGAGATATAVSSSGVAGSGAVLAQGGSGLAKAGGLLGLSMAKWIGGAMLAVGAVGGYVGLRDAATNDPAADPGDPPAQVVAAAPSAAELVPVTRSDAPTSRAAEEKVEALTTSGPLASANARSNPAPRGEPLATAPKAVPAAPAATSKPQVASAEEPASGTGLTGEIALIDSARKALAANDFDGCLARLATYSARYPKGQLAQDAAGIRAAAQRKKSAGDNPP